MRLGLLHKLKHSHGRARSWCGSLSTHPKLRRQWATFARLDAVNCSVPLVGDFHYNGHRLLQEYPDCARALAKYRINPGNVGFGKKRDSQFASMIEAAIEYDRPVRIGVNWGSLDQSVAVQLMDEKRSMSTPLSAQEVTREALIISALSSAKAAEELGLAKKDKMVISCKVSAVQDLIAVYSELAKSDATTLCTSA